MISPALYSSKSHLWGTPQDLFNKYNNEYHFTLDVCALPFNTKCERYFTPDDDGLKQSWSGHTCWMNPPYGRTTTGLWVRKAFYETREPDTIVVGLLPSRTDTRWFHDYIYNKAEIRFIKGRLKFGNSKTGAPFPSMLAIWHKQ